LVANRGEIACRVLRTLKRLGIRGVAVYSEADRGAPHVAMADEAVLIGPAPAAESYLSIDAILAAARQTGAQGIHPGYGFLSENAVFAEACEGAGIQFIGPTPHQIREFGLKDRARELAQQAGLPLLPGSGKLAGIEDALSEAARIGFPVMLKSTAGGGGIGMARCKDETELKASFERVTRLGQNYFKDGSVYIEHFVERARHVEVQIFGDGEGTVVQLGERDCSVQRRNQKVVEETPAPNLPDKVRQALHAAAVRLGQSIKYRSAGTMEFVYDANREEFYFLEVNTRLQVEHCVTEEVTGLDLVEWMVRLAGGERPPMETVPSPAGHAIQVRFYAEDPGKNYQPSSGVLTRMDFSRSARVDGWVEQGTEVTPYYDPLLAKIIVKGASRQDAVGALQKALAETHVAGIQTNLGLLRQIAAAPAFASGDVSTRFLDDLPYQASTVEVIDAGTYTTVQDYPGRVGYWDIGVSPSGPMDDFAFRIANRLVGNAAKAAGLECTVIGPTLRFNVDGVVAITGAAMAPKLDGTEVPQWTSVAVRAGSTLALSQAQGQGCRTYIAFKGGLDVPEYLGSRSTFALGQFGGHAGRTLRVGDVLEIGSLVAESVSIGTTCPAALKPEYPTAWAIGVLYGPHGAPDFLTADGIAMFFGMDWEVHYNSNRLGIRLNGPKPTWARPDGGEAGLHPSNVHDCEYAVGSINFTGDMPIVLTHDGPSLGGFVCPVTIAKAEMWKIGQVKPGDTIRFVPIQFDEALARERAQDEAIATLKEHAAPSQLSRALGWLNGMTAPSLPAIHRNGEAKAKLPIESAIIHTLRGDPARSQPEVAYRQAGDKYILIEYGPALLDLDVRLRVHALIDELRARGVPGLLELSPGVRSLQVRYDSRMLHQRELMDTLLKAEDKLPAVDDMVVPTRVVRMPMAFEDSSTLEAIRRYSQSVRPKAPWLPSNIEFIRRINGLPSQDDVRRIVFEASYLTMGLGDVYLGAPCAVPLDPRHRVLTSKYNPARFYTPEGVVGIGGVYMCIYGMDSPGGYQLIGRTLPIWNKYLKNRDFEAGKPWLLRFFDQVQFYPMDEKELTELRRDYAAGRAQLDIREQKFVLRDYHKFLASIADECRSFKAAQTAAFNEERERWAKDTETDLIGAGAGIDDAAGIERPLVNGHRSIDAHMTGNVWQIAVSPGDRVKQGDKLVVLEAMKMEFAVTAPADGEVVDIVCRQGRPVHAGQRLLVMQH